MRLLFIAAVVVAGVTMIQPLRTRVLPPVQKALGPVAETLMTPAKKWQAKSGCTNLLRELSIAYNQGKAMPDPYSFTNWAKRVTNNDKGGHDPWGRSYYFKPGRNLMTVGSPGPDGFRDTPDDILVTVPWSS